LPKADLRAFRAAVAWQAFARAWTSHLYCCYMPVLQMRRQRMFEDPVAKRTAIGAAVGAVIAIPVPFVGPLFGGAVGAVIGFFSAQRRR
jgi:ABC-type Mn2+/Zn2+ transport system permease subunit